MRSNLGRRIRQAGIVLAALVASVSGVGVTANADNPSPVTPMIVGGRDATQLYPWMTSIQAPHPTTGRIVHYCGGELIRADWVLTAAHCAEFFQTVTTTVRVGAYNWTQGGDTATVVQVVLHPGWRWEPGNDVALLKLDHTVAAQPITLARTPGQVGDLDRILGWGAMCNLTDPAWPCRPSGLQEADVRIAPDSDCHWYDQSVELCVRGADGSAMACFGDSGGPLLKRVRHGRSAHWELIGVTSRDGDADADTNPACSHGTGVWTDTTKFRDWIKHVTHGRPLPADTDLIDNPDPVFTLPYEPGTPVSDGP